MDWLLASIDPSRAHVVDIALAWHGRLMTLAWGVLAPLAVLIARYFKVLPQQDWPRELDSQLWWRSHWMGQGCVVALSLVAVALVYGSAQALNLHARLGYAVLALAVVQVTFGLFRGSKGGPTDPAPDGSMHGDHYDMTPWRVMFEWVHKCLGYALLGAAVLTIVLGLWQANAPRWMWLLIMGWWCGLVFLAVILQRRGHAMDTYQAIWGPGQEHPGNRRAPIGWGIRRKGEQNQPGE